MELYKKLLRAKKNFPPVTKDKTNPFHKNKYASLEGVILTIQDHLHNEGLLLSQEVRYDPNSSRHELLTTITEADSGTCVSGTIPYTVIDDAQKAGSELSYKKRYGLLAFLGIPTEDDDGNTVSVSNKTTKKPQATKPAKASKAQPDNGTAKITAPLGDVMNFPEVDTYVLRAGKKKGTLISAVPQHELNSFLGWINTLDDVGGALAQDKKAIEEFIMKHGTASNSKGQGESPMPDDNENIPF